MARLIHDHCRLNDDGNSQFDASKLPFFDIDTVTAFLQSGMRANGLEHLVLPADPSSLACLAGELQACCDRVFSAVPVAVSATCACHSLPALLAREGGADVARLAAFGSFEYACFQASTVPDADGELGIIRHASSASAHLEVAVVQLSPGERIVDAQFYRDARLLLLVCDHLGAARLDLVDCDLLAYGLAVHADTAALGVC